MLYRVVRPFPLSLDGLTLIDLNAGDEREDFAGMESGLESEGYIEPVAALPVVAQVTEPVEQVFEAAPKPEQRRRRGR